MAFTTILQSFEGLFSIGVAASVGSAVTAVYNMRRQSKQDTIGQQQGMIVDLRREIEKAKAETERVKAERDKLAGRIGQYRIKIVEVQAQNNILRAANEAFAEGIDPTYFSRIVTPQAFLIVDEAGIITDCDEDVRAVLHYYKPEVINKNVEMLIPEEFREAHRVFMAKVRDETVPVDPFNVLSLILINREGVRVPVNIRIHRWKNRVGQLRFTTYIWERIPSPGTNGNGGSNSGDSGTFLKPGDSRASAETKEMSTVAGPGPAKGG